MEYFNTVDHDIKYDRVKVLEIVAFLAEVTEDHLKNESVCTYGIVSSSNITNHAPSPVKYQQRCILDLGEPLE